MTDKDSRGEGVGWVSPYSVGGEGGRTIFKNSSTNSCNLRHSVVVFMTFNKAECLPLPIL